MKPLRLLAVAAIATVGFGAATAAADPVSTVINDPADALDLTTVLATPFDATSSDTSVTDSALASAGIGPDVVSIVDDPNLLIVDDDRAQCPNAHFDTAAGIQLAIAAAPPGGKIRVCPGTYSPINVTKPLTLFAPRQQGQTTECQPLDPRYDAVIE